MRIDLFTGGQRPLHVGIVNALAKRYVGVDIGPPTALSFRPDLFQPQTLGYIIRSSRGSNVWDKGHIELFSAFVSRLNSCGF